MDSWDEGRVLFLEQRARDLEAALRALTANAPLDTNYDMSRCCAYCRAVLPYAGEPAHAPACPWVRAKALLEEAP